MRKIGPARENFPARLQTLSKPWSTPLRTRCSWILRLSNDVAKSETSQTTLTVKKTKMRTRDSRIDRVSLRCWPSIWSRIRLTIRVRSRRQCRRGTKKLPRTNSSLRSPKTKPVWPWSKNASATWLWRRWLIVCVNRTPKWKRSCPSWSNGTENSHFGVLDDFLRLIGLWDFKQQTPNTLIDSLAKILVISGQLVE